MQRYVNCCKSMTKKKHVRRADAAAKKALDTAKDEAVEAATDIKETVTDAAQEAVGTATDTAKKAAETVRKKAARHACPLSKNARRWLVVALVVAAAVFGYKYVTQNNVSGVGAVRSMLAGMPAPGNDVDARDAKQWGYAAGSLIGQQVVQMLAQAPGKDEMDMDMFVRGLTDVVTESKSPLLTENQVRSLLEARIQMEQDKLVAKAKENKAKSDAFVEEFAKKDGVKKLEGGTLYKAENVGTGARVGERAAKVHYRGMHINGEEFDNSRKGDSDEPVTFSADMVVPGVGAALRNMRVGDKWTIVIPADQAYGEQGMQFAGIEPNEALIFEIEIVGLDK